MQKFVKVGSWCYDMSEVLYFGIDSNNEKALLFKFKNFNQCTLNCESAQECQECYKHLVKMMCPYENDADENEEEE